jgi:hypothetical protein
MTKDELKTEIANFIDSEAFGAVEDGEVDLGAAASEIEDFVDSLAEDEDEEEGEAEEADGKSKDSEEVEG